MCLFFEYCSVDVDRVSTPLNLTSLPGMYKSVMLLPLLVLLGLVREGSAALSSTVLRSLCDIASALNNGNGWYSSYTYTHTYILACIRYK